MNEEPNDPRKAEIEQSYVAKDVKAAYAGRVSSLLFFCRVVRDDVRMIRISYTDVWTAFNDRVSLIAALTDPEVRALSAFLRRDHP